MAYTLLLASRSYTVTLICLVCLGAATPGRLNVGLPYMNEWFPQRIQTFIQVIRLIEQTAVLCINVLYFWLIGNSWFTMAFCGYILCVVSMLCTLPFPDSPRLLLAHGKEKEFKEAFDMLARWNGKTLDWSQIKLADRIEAAKLEINEKV